MVYVWVGTEESGSVLKEIFDNLCTEIEALKNFENNNKDKGKSRPI